MIIKCKVCNKIIIKKRLESISAWLNRKACSKKCSYIYFSRTYYGDRVAQYKGGTITKKGYRCLSFGKSGRKLEHRHVMETYINRPLKTEEHVHHINGNKLDNRIENLRLMSGIDHRKLHFPKGSLFGVHKKSTA